jgi:uncharacterized membrane protein YhaH (DUF805 family)
MGTTGGIFFFPFLMDFLNKPIANNIFLNIILRRCCFLLGTYLMTLNGALMLSFAAKEGLTIANELIFFIWLFGIAGYIYMIFIVFMTLVDIFCLIGTNRKNTRYGEDNE